MSAQQWRCARSKTFVAARQYSNERAVSFKGSGSLTKPVLGDCSEGVPPVPIPNTEVKPFSPDGTARASVWESRTLPRLN